MEAISSIVFGTLVTVLGIVGLYLASGAMDLEMLIFGVGMAVFAVLFDIGLVKRHFGGRGG